MISLLPFSIIVIALVCLLAYLAREIASTDRMRWMVFLFGYLAVLGQDTATLGLWGYQCVFQAGYSIQKIVPSRGIYSSSTLLVDAKQKLAAGYEYVEFQGADGGFKILTASGVKNIDHPISRIHAIYYDRRALNISTAGVEVEDTYDGTEIGGTKTPSTAGGWLLSGISRWFFGDPPTTMACGGNLTKIFKDVVILIAPPLTKDDANERN